MHAEQLGHFYGEIVTHGVGLGFGRWHVSKRLLGAATAPDPWALLGGVGL